MEDLEYIVFLPQRDGAESDKPPYDTMSRDERRKALINLDRDQIFDSDIFLFILDGRIPDEGACVELGMAYTNKMRLNVPKFIIGLHTDIRAAFIGSKLNPMVRLCFDNFVENEAELFRTLKEVRNKQNITEPDS